jgi:hypothetical protein
VSIQQSQPEHIGGAHFSIHGAHFGPFKAREYFPSLVSRAEPILVPTRIPPEPFLDLDSSVIHVILARLRLNLITPYGLINIYGAISHNTGFGST